MLETTLCALALLAGARGAAAETLTLPGTMVSVTVPDDEYRVADVDVGGGKTQSMLRAGGSGTSSARSTASRSP